jgi:hypothetical protein
MNENEEQNEKQYDPMVASYFDGTEQQEEENQEQDNNQEEQSTDDAASELARKEAEKIEAKRIEDEKAAELAKAENNNQEQEKPKKWDEGLNDKAKFVLDKLAKGEEKEVWELLNSKFGHEKLSAEQKAFEYLKSQNPYLDEDDISFKLANEYGIGATPLTEREIEDLTEAQEAEIKKQSLAKKQLLNEAENFFSSKAETLEIPALPNPLDEDEGYKEYQAYKAEQAELVKQQEEFAKQQEIEDKRIEEEVKSTAVKIDTLSIDLKLDLDQSEFALKSEFKLDDAKKKQLADYALDYTPTKAEVEAHRNTNGEFDMKGYMTSLAKRLFSEQIQKAVLKQAIAKDREEFTERELKNSTLRNNSNMQFTDRDEAFEVSAMRQ